MAELDIPLNLVMLRNNIIKLPHLNVGMNKEKILNCCKEIKNVESISPIDINVILHELMGNLYLLSCIIKPSIFITIFNYFCTYIFKWQNTIKTKISTYCNYCNYCDVKRTSDNNYISIFNTYGHVKLDDVLNRMMKETIFQTTCPQCKLRISSKKDLSIMPSDFLLIESWNSYEHLIFDNKLTISKKYTTCGKNLVYQLKALITWEEKEPVGKYDVIINKNNNWYLYSKNYIQKLSFDDTIDMKSNIHYLMYKLVK
jgi:hypothetical protein